MDLDEFLNAAADLLAIPSTADRPDQLWRALDFVLEAVGPGFTVERFESRGKPSALVYPGPARERFAVILNAHLDVVPAAHPDQYVPQRDGDRLYARGAHDMKVSALAEAYAFRDLAPTLPYPVALQLVTDEEVGGRDGTRHQLEHGVTGDFVVIGEQSGLDVVADSKGLITVTLAATGAAGHSAYPWLGDNALVKLVTTIGNILSRYPVPAQEAWRTTVNVARIATPNTAFNLIPAEAEALLDVRYPAENADLNGRTPAEVAEHFQRFCEPGVRVTIGHCDPPHHADHDREEVALLRKAAQRQGYPAEFLRKHGAGDGRFYYQRGIDAVAFGIGGHGQHGPVEYVDIATIRPYYQALTEFLTALARR